MTIAPQVTGPRHPFELLFQQLTGRMVDGEGRPVINELGPIANGVAGQPGRVVWTMGKIKQAKRGYRRQGQAFCGFLAVAHSVEINGANPLDVAQTIASLTGWLDILVGPEQGAPDAGDGYEIGESTPVETGDGTSTGSACKLPVTLYLPVYQLVFGRKTVGAVAINVTSLTTAGAVPSGDTLNPLVSAA